MSQLGPLSRVAQKMQNKVKLWQNDPNRNLCHKCKDVFDHWYKRENTTGIVPSCLHHCIDDLVKYARKGCPICDLLIGSLRSDEIEQIRTACRKKPGRLIFWNTNDGDLDQCDLLIDFDVEDEQVEFLPTASISVLRATFSDQSSINKVGNVAPRTDCEITWMQIKQWLEWCAPDEMARILGGDDNSSQATSDSSSSAPEDSISVASSSDMFFAHKTHYSCNRSAFKSKLPTRLVDVASDDDGLRLCLTEHLPPGDEILYAALSHCWGTEGIKMVTTRDNVDEMQICIPFHSLTKTFQDAIIITRHLGLRYLWIDSLCILQGDEMDWRSESSFMGNIYAGSFLNIVAADAENGSVGCFFDRDVQKLYGCKVWANASRGSNERDIWNCMPHQFGYLQIADCAIAKRGWCFQETFMAPRSLYFCKSQIFWECRHVQACESFPQGIHIRSLPFRSISDGWHVKVKTNHFSDWFRLIEDYSIRDLSFSKDKLIAISGIARLYSNEFSLMYDEERDDQIYHYLAGIWRQKMEQQLMWVVSEKHCKPCNKSLQAPSWSWASVDGMVFLPGDDDHYATVKFTVVDASVTLCTDDEFGEVNGGSLTLRCQPLILVGVNADSELVVGGPSGSKISNSVVYPDVSQPDFGDMLYALPAWSWWEVVNSERWGLLLQRTGRDFLFRRVGAYKLDDEKGVDIEEAESLLDTRHGWTSGESDEVDREGNRWHIITII